MKNSEILAIANRPETPVFNFGSVDHEAWNAQHRSRVSGKFTTDTGFYVIAHHSADNQPFRVLCSASAGDTAPKSWDVPAESDVDAMGEKKVDNYILYADQPGYTRAQISTMGLDKFLEQNPYHMSLTLKRRFIGATKLLNEIHGVSYECSKTINSGNASSVVKTAAAFVEKGNDIYIGAIGVTRDLGNGESPYAAKVLPKVIRINDDLSLTDTELADRIFESIQAVWEEERSILAETVERRFSMAPPEGGGSDNAKHRDPGRE